MLDKENFVVGFPTLSLGEVEENLHSFENTCEFTLETPFDDDLFNAIVDNRYDVTITDNEGNSVELKDKALECQIRITKRIPRKMKKALKKKHGKFWKFYHPNTETVYTFN